jgi:hypothetical protein
MALFNVDNITMNPEEIRDFAGFIIEQTFMRPELAALHGVSTGIKMKDQIVFAGRMGKVGLKGTANCDPQNSGAELSTSEKFWNPEGIEDRLSICQKDVDALFKAYYSKIQAYKERFDITGSDEDTFIIMRLEEAMMATIWRAAWLGDKNIAAATAGVAGLKSAANVKFYDYIDGLWDQIFTAASTTVPVPVGSVGRVEISENAETSISAQTTLASGRADAIFEDIWSKADSRLREDPDAQFYVSRGIWENYRQFLKTNSLNFTIEHTVEGFPFLDWNGKKIINMENVWDRDLQADFTSNTTDNAYYLPNRVVLTVKENIPIGTLNENDMSTIDVWYDKKDRKVYYEFGFDEDAKLLEEYMMTVAY